MKKLGFGLMRLPVIEGGAPTDIDLEAFKAMVDEFMAKGFTYYDTAYVYHGGKSEVAFREAVVKRYPRDSFTITTKLPVFDNPSVERMEEIFNEQLERCGVDYFDYYWLHSMNASKYAYLNQPEIDGYGFIVKKKEEGKVKHIGFSFHDKADVLDQILTDHPEVEFVQLQINYIDWEDDNVQSRLCYEVCVKHGKPVIVMEPVKGGSLAGLPEKAEEKLKAYNPDASIASWAVRYVASLDNVMMVLSGMSNQQQLTDNTNYMQDFQPLNEEEQALIAEVTDIIKQSIAIPCTGCHYCTDGCPMQIAIPEYFSTFNNLQKYPLTAERLVNTYARQSKERGKASECIQCGQCEGVCPQHIGIIEWLPKVAEAFEK